MNVINGITEDPKQVLQVNLPDGSQFTFELFFRPQQAAWFFSVNWPGPAAGGPGLEMNGRHLVVSGNLLRQFRSLIPFGLAVFSPDNADPITQSCLSDGTVAVVLLNQADLSSIESQVYAAP